MINIKYFRYPSLVIALTAFICFFMLACMQALSAASGDTALPKSVSVSLSCPTDDEETAKCKRRHERIVRESKLKPGDAVATTPDQEMADAADRVEAEREAKIIEAYNTGSNIPSVCEWVTQLAKQAAVALCPRYFAPKTD